VTTDYPVLEHRERRADRWLRGNRLRIAFLIALVETILVLTDVVGWFVAVGVAAAVIALHLLLGRRAKREWIRQLSWTLAVSQTLPVLIPIAAVVVGTFLVLAIVAGVVIILAFLVFGRR
jgi:hypothetical protein